MDEKLEIKNSGIEYKLRKSKRAKRLRIAVHCDSSVVVTVPYGFDDAMAREFVTEKIKWITSKQDYFRQFKYNPLISGGKDAYLKYKREAYDFAKKKIEYYNGFYNFSYNKINIRNQKTRWGSCSKRGNLNFSYKIVLLPERVADYIIIHELCHLKEFNHSKNFWDLLAKTMPDYLSIRSELRKHII